MPKIIINEKTRDYILKKGGIITINREMAGSSWASVPMAIVRFGKPEIISSYILYEISSIKIYVINGLKLKRDYIKIELINFLGIFKNLEVYGFELL